MAIFRRGRFVKVVTIFGTMIGICYIMLQRSLESTESDISAGVKFVPEFGLLGDKVKLADTANAKLADTANAKASNADRPKAIQKDLRKHVKVGIVLPVQMNNRKAQLIHDLIVSNDWLLLKLAKGSLYCNTTVYFGIGESKNVPYADIASSSMLVKAVMMNNGTMVEMMNHLARAAYLDGMEYIAHVTDTGHVQSDGWGSWFDTATEMLGNLDPPNVGVVIPASRDGYANDPVKGIVHKTHLEVFYNYYPPQVIVDNVHQWLTNVYTKAQFIQLSLEGISDNNVRISASINDDVKSFVHRGQSRLEFYLAQHELVTPTNKDTPTNETDNYFLGAVVVMAPRRNQGLPGYEDDLYGPRLCLFFHMIQTVDKHLNVARGTHYPIFVILSADPYADPYNKDGHYTAEDRDRIQSWAPNSDVRFIELNMYTKDALTPGSDLELILKWERGEDGAVAGRPLGYRSMCRLWSGRLQQMAFMQRYKYYMRLDDDSLFRRALPKDPFKEMDKRSLQYVFIRRSTDQWGYEHLKAISKPYGKLSGYYVPYTNFHMARTEFFLREDVLTYWKDLEKQFAFFKYRIGDATLHGALLDLFMANNRDYTTFGWIPYAHNSNDFAGYPPRHWAQECGQIEIRTKSGA